MKLSLSADEMAALYGLPFAAICLYVMAIRPRMDFATGLVGVRPRISWHALTEWLYVEQVSGPLEKGSPSVDQVRRLARHLVRVGLVQMRSSEIHRQLVFFCPLAHRDNSVQIQPARNPPDQPARQPDRGYQRGNAPNPPDNPPDPNTLNPPDIRSPKGSYYHHHNIVRTQMSESGGGGGDLIWPKSLTKGERAAIGRMIEANSLNGSSQLLLDELQGAIGTKGVSNKVGYARRIVQAMIEGKFTPERAIAVQEGRARQAEIERQEADRRPADPAAARRSLPGKLGDVLKKRRAHVER